MATTKAVDKWKMKQWFDVYAPKEISGDVIGSIPAGDEKAVVGRIMKVSLNWITHNPNHSYTMVGLRVSDANGNVANTDVDYLAQQNSYLHSLVKRRADAVYTFDTVKSKDGASIRLKLLVTTRIKVARKIKTNLRKAVTKFVSGYVGAENKNDFIKSLVTGELQAEGAKMLSQVAPVAKVEIKRIEF